MGGSKVTVKPMSLEDMARASYPFDPFSIEYTKREIKRMNIPEFDTEGVRCVYQQLPPRCDEYLNVSMPEQIKIPYFLIDGVCWMSMAPMEVQSHVFPLDLMSGNCAILGLGMGYFTWALAQREEVDAITVFEIDQRAIDIFKSWASDVPGFDKLTFVEGDARANFKDYKVDSAYVDIYPSMHSNEAISDIEVFRNENSIYDEYRFWGMESLLYQATQNDMIRSHEVSYTDRFFLIRFLLSDMSGLTISFEVDEDYLTNALDTMRDFHILETR